jgi:hypothetical protein
MKVEGGPHYVFRDLFPPPCPEDMWLALTSCSLESIFPECKMISRLSVSRKV